MNHGDPLQRLLAHYQAMPPVAAMQLGIAGYDGQRLQLHAPLAAHVNDKGCAFGGSLASMMTLASWGLVWLQIEAAGLHADVFVADSQIRYLAPLFADLHVEAELAPDADWPSFIARLRERGRARQPARPCPPARRRQRGRVHRALRRHRETRAVAATMGSCRRGAVPCAC